MSTFEFTGPGFNFFKCKKETKLGKNDKQSDKENEDKD